MTGRKDASYYRDYRERRKASGAPVPRGSRTPRRGESSSFIAWDGEGYSSEEVIDEHTNEHYFVLFASSAGDVLTLKEGQKRLSTVDCLNLLIRREELTPGAIHVVYGGSYDMNQILRDLPEPRMRELAKDGDCYYQGFFITFHPRKSLTIRRGNTTVTLWDVIGFFQMSFVKAIEQWLGKDYHDLALIAEGKANRVQFDFTRDSDFIKHYNDAELHALVQLMQRFRHSVLSLDLRLKRWDGAGAVAAAIFEQRGFKTHAKAPAPREAEQAARHAYFGGRFELGQYGIHDGEVFGYDINSAYPAVFRDMPSLNHGRWIHTTCRDPTAFDPRGITAFALYRIDWNLPGARFAPFPYRDPLGLVSFPTTGANWVWGCELAAYFSIIPDSPAWEVRVYESWTWHASNEDKPFAWVNDYYATRQAIVDGTSLLPYGAQMVIKLGLNSLYGKTAQSLGYQPDSRKLPPYHNLFYAGFITASTRAKLWLAAMQAPEHIVMMATDGILSTAPLELPVTEKKVLGAWEHTKYDFLLSIQSGVYILGKAGSFQFRRRGIDAPAKIEYFIEQVKRHWGNRVNISEKMNVTQTRLVGLKIAVSSQDFVKRWGAWYEHNHLLQMEPGANTKRQKDGASPNRKPGKGLVLTLPSFNVYYEIEKRFSEAYERPWDREEWAWDEDSEDE